MSDTLPIVMSVTGLVPKPPAVIAAELITSVAATNPGYTANLPGTLIEDVLSTDVAAVAACDSALVELVNSVTPLGANPYTLNQIGQVVGVARGQTTNTSVYVVFTDTSAGLPIPVGFTVSDGANQFTVVSPGVIGSGLSSEPLFCVADLAGPFAVPADTVNQLITQAPPGHALTCNNPLAGTPQGAPQTVSQYRAQVLQAFHVGAQGFPSYVKTLLGNVPGVDPGLVSVVQINGGGWEVIVGGTGDPYQIGDAIYRSIGDISTLVGSTIAVTGITNASPGVVTTNINHELSTGQVATINGVVGMTGINGVGFSIIVLSEKSFSIGTNTTGFGTWVSGGVVTPNARNVVVNINDYPDVYSVPFVVPPAQTVAITLTWNTTSTNSVSAANMASLGASALIDYVNGIAPGQPMNLFELQNAFQLATVSILPTALLTRMVFAVEINGLSVSPTSGTGIISGDPESYFSTNSGLITITQG